MTSTSSTPPGRLIAFEGGEGSGKSTQARILADHLGAVLTKEPGGTALGRHIRALVLEADARPAPKTEALLLAADRCQHVYDVIGAALLQGHDVVCDRFTGSFLAYQGYGRGLDVGELRWLSEWAAEGITADLNVRLDVPLEVAVARKPGPGDRFEREGASFHERVAEGYRRLAAADPARWVVVDATGTVDEVASRVRAAFEGWAEGR